MNHGPRVRIPEPAPGADSISGSALALQPELLQSFMRLYGTLWSRGVLDHTSKEIARLRNARTVQCSYCKSVRFDQARKEGLSEERVSMIDHHYADSELDEREKLVIRYADAFLGNPGGDHQALIEAMETQFSQEQRVELTAALALFMGFSKIAVSVGGMPDSLPVTVVPTPGQEAS